jgi:hypothetical protein
VEKNITIIFRVPRDVPALPRATDAGKGGIRQPVGSCAWCLVDVVDNTVQGSAWSRKLGKDLGGVPFREIKLRFHGASRNRGLSAALLSFAKALWGLLWVDWLKIASNCGRYPHICPGR